MAGWKREPAPGRKKKKPAGFQSPQARERGALTWWKGVFFFPGEAPLSQPTNKMDGWEREPAPGQKKKKPAGFQSPQAKKKKCFVCTGQYGHAKAPVLPAWLPEVPV